MTYEEYLEICYHLDEEPMTEKEFKERSNLKYIERD